MLAASHLRKAVSSWTFVSVKSATRAVLDLPQHTGQRTRRRLVQAAGSVKLVLIGDVHHQWDAKDAIALKSLQPDIALFVGDFGEDVVELVQTIKQQIDAHNIPAAYILGNHDAWTSLNKTNLSGIDDPRLAGVQAQLHALGQDHVGYGYKQFPDHHISVVGGRPFSSGGSIWEKAARFNHIMYGVGSMQAAADRISANIGQQPAEHAVVVMAHNGPAGLGEQQQDICGKDWSHKAGDHGDPDLQIALDRAASAGKPVALAVFGHMHHTLRAATGNCIRRRNMVHIDADRSTVFINCAVVPRWGVSHDAQSDGNLGSLHHFTVVNIAAAGYVESASHVWVDVNDSQYPVVQHEDIVWTNSYKDGKLHRTCLNTGGAIVSASPSTGSLLCHHSVVSSY